jgi:hypothetical protein
LNSIISINSKNGVALMRFKSNNIFRMLLIICLLLTMAVPAWAATSGSVAISADSNDADEDGLLGNVYTGPLEVDVPLCDYITGMRFFPAIPSGATILDAYISFTASFTDNIGCSLTFFGEDAVNPATFTAGNGTFGISSRSTTGASVPWSPGSWTLDLDYDSPPLTSIVQEIVDSGGGTGANAMVIITTIGTGWRSAYSIEGGKPPALHFTYNGPPVADDESFTVLQGGTATEADLDAGTSLLDGDTDDDIPGDTLTPVLDIGPSYATSFTLNVDGTFSYTPDNRGNFSDSFTYHLNDGTADSNIATVTITITPGTRTLNVWVDGTGTVRSVPAGTVDCGFATFICSAPYPVDSSVTLEATPESGWTFNRWVDDLGNPLSTANPDTFTMDVDKTVRAIFDHRGYHIINANAPGDGNGGRIDPSPDTFCPGCGGQVMVADGDSQTFTITPDALYHVKDVMVDFWSVGPVLSYTFNSVSSDHDIWVNFELDAPQYSIWSTAPGAGSGGTITRPGDLGGVGGEEVVISGGNSEVYTITPDAGWHIQNVRVDNQDIGPVTSYQFTNVNSTHNIWVNFEQDAPEYTIWSSSWPIEAGTIFPEGSTTVSAGASIEYTITPFPGVHVKDVFVDGVSVGAVGSYIFNDVNSSHNIDAEFEVDVGTAVVEPMVLGLGGTINPPDTATYAAGSSPIFTITPDTGFRVRNVNVYLDWNLFDIPVIPAGGGTYTFSSIEPGMYRIEAEFDLMPGWAVIRTLAGFGGRITPPGRTVIASGSTPTYTITPDAGFKITNVDVYLNGALYETLTPPAINETGDTYTFPALPDGRHRIEAAFEIVDITDHIISTYENPPVGGSISPSGPVVVTDGSTQPFTITPAAGYHIINVSYWSSGSGTVDLGPDPPFEIPNITENHNLYAYFAINTYEITHSSNAGGIISPLSPVIVFHGADQDITITPDPGYLVDSVLVDGLPAVPAIGPAGGTHSFTNVQEVHSIIVTFVNDPPVANDDTADAVNEGGTVTTIDTGQTSVLHDDTDPESAPLTAVLDTGPAYASAFALNADGTFSYTHNNS